MSYLPFSNTNLNNVVISNRVRNLSIDTESSPSYLRSRKDKWHVGLVRFLVFVFFSILSVQSFSQSVKKVVSLAPSITENIYLLNAQDKLVGCTSYCTEAVADGIETIGSTIDVNVEKIFALQPDIVLTMELTKFQDLETMRKVGLNVVLIPTPKTFDEICEQTIEIGNLLGAEKVAEKVVSKTKNSVNDIIQKNLSLSEKQKIFFQIGSNPIFTVLENTFMDEFILLNNGENIANGMNKGTMTRESVLVKNPDVIIIATMGGFGKEEKEIWESFKGLAAAKNKKIFLIESEIACSPTPDNFAIAFSRINQFINQ